MVATNLAIHIPPDANPTNVTQMVMALADTQEYFDTSKELMEFAEAQGIGSRNEIQQIATAIGLLEKTGKGISLSNRGTVLAKLRADIQPDILHFLIYISWQATKPLENLYSWAYRNCCERYWEAGTIQLDSPYLNKQVEETINEARHVFSQLGSGENFEEISFSRKSLLGAHKWLEALVPKVIENTTFMRRAFCSPELLLLAIGHVLQDEPDITEYDILLSRDKRMAICKICLLEPDSFDRALDWAIPIFPKVIAPGTSAGFYGRFIRLHKIPTVEDILR